MSHRPILRPAIAATVAVISIGVLLSVDFSSQAVQMPRISLDMDPSTNSYTPSVDADGDGIPDPGTNAMTVGTVENCLTSIPGNNAEHSHPVHLIIQDVEDLIAWQVRINFDGTRAAPANINFQPFTDTALESEPISFLNLPVDSVWGGHRPLYGAQEVLNPTDIDATALFGAAALGEPTFAVSPDVPEKSPHDETARTYSVSGGGLLAALDFVTRAGQDGQPSLQLDLDDASPNPPGSKVVIFDGSGLRSILLPNFALGDGHHGEGATCQAIAEPPAPPNDFFQNALEIVSLPFSDRLNTEGATTEPGNADCPFAVEGTVWYSFIPDSDMTITADTFGSDFDTILGAYTGTSIFDLHNVACNDQFNGDQSRISFAATAGTEYFFQVGGVLGAVGNLVFNVVSGGPPLTATPTPPPPATPTRTPSPYDEPTAAPTPTPGPPGPTPPSQPGPERFNPHLSATYSDTSPGSHPDVSSTLSLGLGPDGQRNTADDTGDYNFAGIVNFSPSSPRDADIPDGAITGIASANSTLGLVNSACATWIPVSFTFIEATTDITNTIEPLPYGSSNDLSPLAGDNNQNGNPEVQPPPAVTKYPSYLNAIFDPDWVDFGPDRIAGNADDNNGPQPPLQPIARFAAATPIPSASNIWIILQEVVFEPGTKLPRLPAFDPELGYPSVTMLQQSSAAGSAAPPAPSAISDFCTPLDFNMQSYGITRDNPDTAANEGGVNLRTLPQARTTLTSTFFAFSQRDADGDGFENSLDPCPFHADTVWDPRANPPKGDDDRPFGLPSQDGIPDTCDPTRTEATGGPPANQPTDHDGDGFLNRGDNCPLHSNPDQADRDVNEWGEIVGDGIGDVCDTPGTDAGTDSAGRPIPGPRTVAGNGPNTPDGGRIVCIKTLTTTVGGPPEATVSECQEALPGIVSPCSCAPVSPPPQAADVTVTGESVGGPAPARTPAVAGVAALPRTGEDAGSALPGPVLALAFAAGLAAGTAAAAARVWKMRRR